MPLIDETFKKQGIWLLDIPSVIAKKVIQCDECKMSIDSSKPKKTKEQGEKPNPAIDATLETGIDTGETKQYNFCDERCLLNFLRKRYK